MATGDENGRKSGMIPMPGILYGTAWKQEQTAALVQQALTKGFRGIDTACQPKHYHEAGVGQGIAAALGQGLKRSELYLQTKFTPLPGQDPNRIPYDPEAPLSEQVEQSFQASLRNLGTDFLDGLLLHSPLATVGATLTAWKAMEKIHLAGGVHRLGISNCQDPRLLEYLILNTRIKPAVVQNRFHAQTGYDREIRALCKRLGIVYQSFWTLTANPHLLAHAALTTQAGKLGCTAEQLFFRLLTQRGITPLTGTTATRHMEEDLAIFSIEMEEASWVALEKALFGV
ncbi:MAG: aldo/keto reductase [Magnetococcales bacterium]|nr:aldo/keto reductase [Magnetococcales bacterium]